jgi:hypothetical protein
MDARYLFPLLSVAFLVAALVRVLGGRRLSHPQIRTWLLMAAIFAAVSVWLWSRA